MSFKNYIWSSIFVLILSFDHLVSYDVDLELGKSFLMLWPHEDLKMKNYNFFFFKSISYEFCTHSITWLVLFRTGLSTALVMWTLLSNLFFPFCHHHLHILLDCACLPVKRYHLHRGDSIMSGHGWRRGTEQLDAIHCARHSQNTLFTSFTIYNTKFKQWKV